MATALGSFGLTVRSVRETPSVRSASWKLPDCRRLVWLVLRLSQHAVGPVYVEPLQVRAAYHRRDPRLPHRQWPPRLPHRQWPPRLPHRQCWTVMALSVAVARSRMAAPLAGAADVPDVPTTLMPTTAKATIKIIRIIDISPRRKDGARSDSPHIGHRTHQVGPTSSCSAPSCHTFASDSCASITRQ